MFAIITALIMSLIGWLIKQVMTWFLSVYDDIFYNAMAVETTFSNLMAGDTPLFNLTEVYKTIYTFAIALLILFFIKKLVETYFAWSNGDPETSPFTIVIGFIKAMIIMICFGFIYETLVEVFHQLYTSILNNGFGTFTNSTILSQLDGITAFLNFIGAIVYLFVGIICFLIYFQNLGRRN